MTVVLSTTIISEIAVQARLSAPDTGHRIETDTVSRELSVETTTGVRSESIARLLDRAGIRDRNSAVATIADFSPRAAVSMAAAANE